MSLTPAESIELQRLLAKAKSRPGPSSDDCEGMSIYDPKTGAFVSSETGEMVDVWAAAEDSEVFGAMTDGSKRPRRHAVFPADQARGGLSSHGSVAPCVPQCDEWCRHA
jgi:hypothetical protein